MKECAGDQLPIYIDKFLWREICGKTGTETLRNIMRDISTQYLI